jgi:hypothetical protein
MRVGALKLSLPVTVVSRPSDCRTTGTAASISAAGGGGGVTGTAAGAAAIDAPVSSCFQNATTPPVTVVFPTPSARTGETFILHAGNT